MQENTVLPGPRPWGGASHECKRRVDFPGHPVGCTGLAQVYELATQLRGRAGQRQVKGARIGMHINGGGVVGVEEASLGIDILEKGIEV